MASASPTPAAPSPATAAPAAGSLVLDERFDNHTSASWQPYSVGMLNSDFGTIAARAVRGFSGGGTEWPSKNMVGEGVLRANYPANKAGGHNSGFIFDRFFPGAEEATLEYRVRFEGAEQGKAFEWAAGGKLPGLGGTVGGQSPTGCTTNASAIEGGFSARLMWRKGGALAAYMYLPDRDRSRCGVDITFFEGATPDRWYTIRQHIRLNTPGMRDGVLEMFVDGRRTLQKTDMYYRMSGKSKVQINNVLFHTYRGGKPDDSRFYSPNSDHVQFDDFKVWVK
ncbi:MAG: polysaccharide lyase [Dermatophilaceae bacterium]